MTCPSARQLLELLHLCLNSFLPRARPPDISDALSTRYQNGNMYTSVGPVLIATNPYQLNTKPSSCTEGGVRSIYDDAVALHYFNSAATEVRALSCKPRSMAIPPCRRHGNHHH